MKQPMTAQRKRDMRLFIGFLVAVVAVVVAIIIFADTAHIQDTNGPDDYSLCQLTMEDLVKTTTSYSGSLVSSSASGASTHVRGSYADCDYTKCTFKAGKITGTQVIHATETMADTLTLRIDAQCEAGNLAVIILVDGEFYANVPVNSAQTIVLEQIAGKEVLVKMGAESAKVKITVQRTIG